MFFSSLACFLKLRQISHKREARWHWRQREQLPLADHFFDLCDSEHNQTGQEPEDEQLLPGGIFRNPLHIRVCVYR